MSFEAIERKELIIDLYSTRQARQLQQFGQLHYVSRKMKYAILYIQDTQSETLIPQIEAMSFVKSVADSPKKQINMDFSQALDPDDDRFIRSLKGSLSERSIDQIVASFKDETRSTEDVPCES